MLEKRNDVAEKTAAGDAAAVDDLVDAGVDAMQAGVEPHLDRGPDGKPIHPRRRRPGEGGCAIA